MVVLILDEAKVVAPISRNELIDALSPVESAEFLARYPGRDREYFVAADGRIVHRGLDEAQTQTYQTKTPGLFARSLKRQLDLHI